jgi:hypothetical protein
MVESVATLSWLKIALMCFSTALCLRRLHPIADTFLRARLTDVREPGWS